MSTRPLSSILAALLAAPAFAQSPAAPGAAASTSLAATDVLPPPVGGPPADEPLQSSRAGRFPMADPFIDGMRLPSWML